MELKTKEGTDTMNETNYDTRATLYAALRPYLHDGEEVLWTGKPYASVPFVPNIGTVIFAIFFFGFSVFWTVGASAAGGAFGLFGLPFIGMGCFLIYQMLFGQKKQYKKTVYAVTDRRAIILTHTLRGASCTDFPFANLQSVTLSAVRGEAGSILFPSFYTPNHYPSSHRGATTVYYTASGVPQNGFYMIDNVRSVYRLISERTSEENRR